MEYWKDIKGYEGIYQVSNHGRVRSLNRTDSIGRIISGRILSYSLSGSGYRQLALSKNDKVRYFQIHRLVAEAFIPNPNNLPCVNHKNENKTDNRVENLEWCDKRYNLNYGTAKDKLIQSLTNNPKTSRKIEQYSLNGDILKSYPSLREAERTTNVPHQNIHKCCIGKYRYAGGFVWKYAD